MTKKSTKPPPRPAKQLPTYSELADIVAELTESNIAGLDHNGPGTWSFVACFTYGKEMPSHWKRAIDAREALIENQAIPRQNRHK